MVLFLKRLWDIWQHSLIAIKSTTKSIDVLVAEIIRNEQKIIKISIHTIKIKNIENIQTNIKIMGPLIKLIYYQRELIPEI